MNDKKTQQQVDRTNGSGIINFIGEIKSEFNKISWTSRDELRTYTKIVVGATFAFGLGVYFMDIFIQASLNTLNYALRIISG